MPHRGRDWVTTGDESQIKSRWEKPPCVFDGASP
jgi:hypothetical protein